MTILDQLIATATNQDYVSMLIEFAKIHPMATGFMILFLFSLLSVSNG